MHAILHLLDCLTTLHLEGKPAMLVWKGYEGGKSCQLLPCEGKVAREARRKGSCRACCTYPKTTRTLSPVETAHIWISTTRALRSLVSTCVDAN